MKKFILPLPLGLITFVTALLLSVNVSLKKDVQDDIFMSAIALAQGEGGSSTQWSCYSTYSTCGWWGEFWGTCDTIYKCGNPCASTKGTDLRDIGHCFPSN